MKILHTADWHFRPDARALLFASIDTIIETVKREDISLVVLAGDLYDRVVHNSAAAGLPELVGRIEQITHLCPMVAVQGTISHDVPGCYAVLTKLGDHNFTLLDPGKAYALYGCGYVAEWGVHEEDYDQPRLLILGTGEPSKEWFLADKTGLGREEAAEAVVGGMRQLLLGLGAIRKEHADLPCVMVYHGQVSGATMANGQTLRPGGIQVGRDDLALVGADYYALGDIHLAQQIGDLPAYYAGSAYPCNWGEVDQKQVWLVDFGVPVDYEVVGDRPFPRVDAVPFPHPPRRKIVLGPTEWLSESPEGQVWVVLKGTKAELEACDPQGAYNLLMRSGAAEGSRVTLEEIPTETVRAGEISEAQGLSAKLQIYAKNSNEALPVGVPEKAEQLEAEARAAGAAPAGLHIRIDKLRLRGAIGIWKGQGVDDLELDLGTYDDGLIALLGPNGAGKTTLIDFLQPFVEKSRGSKLQDCFRLRDSYQDLYWTDVRTGETYRAFIQIDGANASGGCDYHLYRNGEPIANGHKADYEARIVELFGSLSLYLRSAFVTQRASRGAPELSEATKGERKALFRELGGLDYLQDYADRAKAHRTEIETVLVGDRREIEVLERDTTEIPDYASMIATERTGLEINRKLIESIEASGKDLRMQATAAQARLDAHRKAETELNGLRNQVVTLGHDRANAEQVIVALQHAQEQKPEIEREIAEYEALKAEEGKLNEARTGVLLERERIQTQHRHALEAHRAQQRKIEQRERDLKAQEAAVTRETDVALATIDRLQERLSHPVECPACHHNFVVGGEADERTLKERQQHVCDLGVALAEIERKQKAVAVELTELVSPVEPKLPTFDEAPLADLQDRIIRYDVRGLRESLAQAVTADAKIEAAHARIAATDGQLSTLRTQISATEANLDEAAIAEYAELAKRLTALESQWRDARAEVARLEAEVKALEAQIAEVERKRGLLAETRARVVASEADAAAWAWLQRACGVDGIQALELDALGPGVASVANCILESAYSSRFRIEFRTTRIGGKGGSAKQIEDFAIIVHDSERGGEQPIETLSGGEGVWIKRAIYDAFGIVRDRATGQRFLTCFQDEADGQLDPEARLAYFRMLEAAHHESGRRHTIIVTHSPEMQEAISQSIGMSELSHGA